MSPELKTLFEPKSVVLVGASDLVDDEMIYSKLFQSLIQNVSNFKKGKIQTVDLSGKVEKSDKNIGSVRMGQDLAILLLPKKILERSLPKLLAKQVKSLVLIEGRLDDKQLLELSNTIKRKKMVLLGPNSVGVINTANGLAAVSGPVRVSKGNVAVVSQDRCVTYSLLDLARPTGISKLVSVGGIGTDVVEILDYLSRDKETNTICVYINRIKDGRKLVKTIKEIVKEKPVIVLSGRAERSKIFEAAIKQSGGFQAHDVEEMSNWAGGLARQPPMRGEKVAIVTNLSGQAKLFERYLLEEGLSSARPSEDVIGKIRKKHPEVEISSFIGLGSAARADTYKFVVELLLSDENVDGVAVINSTKPTLFEAEDLEKMADIAKKSKEKPVVDVVTCGEDQAVVNEIMSTTELPIYNQLDEAAKVLKVLRLRGRQLESLQKK